MMNRRDMQEIMHQVDDAIEGLVIALWVFGVIGLSAAIGFGLAVLARMIGYPL